ncbi:DHA2 family efflux MFS transporter permease subunit [Herbaspirillum autotrophicum]|uniref:DHA2 family efflux MFS transporter permease subunit n=1 Tax=Herbaspirillum autotrophicum TaxID=180195 RepID=UPI00067AEE61|nr:DHA2 family efflux MFS transporter permease subunit [Herbaspirillum autotrophicum]
MTAAVNAKSRLHWLPYIVAATFFMEYLDTTIIATALPQMAQTFHVGPNELSLGMTAYMLTLAVFIPISGWVADRLGSRTVFGTAIVIFTLASVLCGISGSVFEFTAARILQGMGGALMVPVGRLIVVRNTSKDKLMQAISTITWPAIAAPVVGPALGGFITTYFSWHWIFLINVPFGIAALIAVLSIVPNERGTQRRPLDLVGFFLSGTALTSLLYGTELASHTETNLTVSILFIVAGIVLGLFSYRHGIRSAHPLLDYSTLKIPTFNVTIVTGSFTRIGIEAVPYLLPLLFQIGFGLSAFHSGMLLLASALGNLGMKMFTTRVLRRFGFRRVSLNNAVLAGVFVLACGLLTPDTPLVVVLLTIFIYGLSRSMQFSTLATLAYADVTEEQKSAASTLWSVAQQMTIGMGIAFGALALRVASYFSGGTDDTGAHFSVTDFHWAFAMAGILILCSALGYRRLEKDAGNNLGGGARALPKSR